MKLSEKIKNVEPTAVPGSNISFAIINIELGKEWNDYITMDDTDFRALAATSPWDPVNIKGTRISLSQLIGKSTFAVVNINGGESVKLKDEVDKVRPNFDGEVIVFINKPLKGDKNNDEPTLDMNGSFSNVVLYNDSFIESERGPAIDWRGKQHSVARGSSKIRGKNVDSEVNIENRRTFNG